MTAIRGVWGALEDVAGTKYKNNIEDIRSSVWEMLGRTQGILRGFTMAPDPGVLTVTFQPGSALIEERGTDITGNSHGFYVFEDNTVTVAFDAPSAATRNDALVFAWAEPQYGALKASTPSSGPQIIVVKGTSGSSTPRTDSQIDAAVGPGGWFRYADVLIAPGNTSVQAGNITRNFPDANDRVGNTRYIRKTATQSVSASTTPVNDSHLVFPAAANATYKVEFTLFWLQPGGATSSMDGKVGLSVPSGSWQGGVHGPDIGIASGDGLGAGIWTAVNGADLTTISFGVINATGLITVVKFWATVSVGSTGGNVALRWAQHQSAAGALTLNAGSDLTYTRMA